MGSALAKDKRASDRVARSPGAIRVMVVDDSITARSAIVRTIDSRRDMQVVATAGSAEVALELLDDRRVDVILLDLEMPGMGGLKALPDILRKANGAKVLVVSTLTTAGAEPTLAALAMGAADTLAKPRTGTFGEAYRADLLEKVAGLAQVEQSPLPRRVAPPPAARRGIARKPGVIAIGASTGGIHALGRFFGALSPQIRAPILITQHLPHAFMPVFARQISTMSGRSAHVAEEGMVLKENEIFIAPGDGHLMLRECEAGVAITIAKLDVASGCCPSVDPMFEAVANFFGTKGMGVVLSGMGRDGSVGGRLLNEVGGTLLAQNEESCAVFGMPRGIVEAGIAASIDTPEALADLIGIQAGVS
ncbi:chemotaxis-specific protein-glutamate methyltransferase CheB [Parerythrobacter aestuarii]|uniref:chemotaxis-specific protein-glutamate methyltransferase CheB n=1 Tax=Parerythrobacter aestuarii TaxID=3020909 RepID=UPI0024DE4297|nr:chemotaxis-specific protein-glutamate methyltransferase CheB [Parerythrobacter aestuarii]